MASIIDRILNIRPAGLPPTTENISRTADAPTPGDFRSSFVGILGQSPTVHLRNPYKPNVTGVPTVATPHIPMSGQFIPPNRRTRHPANIMSTGKVGLAASLAPGQSVRLGISHPGRRLGRTGNPGKAVGQR